MLVIGLIAGVALTISATSFASGGISEISAYLREGFTFKVNGQVANLENTPIVYKDTSYMPVRELAGMLGYDVGFEDNTITLDTKTPPATPAATEQVKDVDDVTTVMEQQTIDIDMSEWISFDELREKYNFEYKIGLPEGEPKTSLNRAWSLTCGDRTEVFIIPRMLVVDYMTTNDNGNQLLIKSGGNYVKKSFVTSFMN